LKGGGKGKEGRKKGGGGGKTDGRLPLRSGKKAMRTKKGGKKKRGGGDETRAFRYLRPLAGEKSKKKKRNTVPIS